jgi:hypothetical protein
MADEDGVSVYVRSWSLVARLWHFSFVFCLEVLGVRTIGLSDVLQLGAVGVPGMIRKSNSGCRFSES